MTSRNPYPFAAGAVVAGVAGLALAIPAAAMADPPAPPPTPVSNLDFVHTQHGGSVTQTPTGSTSVTDEDSPWAEIALGALGGVALAGVGIAASVAVRRRSMAQAHPA
jgi:hypothetical protein